MKIFIIFFILMIALPGVINAQQTDDNTFLIQKYFENTVENQGEINSFSENSEIQSYVNTVQIGYDNNIYIRSLQTGDSQVVNQTGTQNNYEYYNYYSRENSNLNVNQEGTLNSLQVFGENSLMKNATINQKSDFQGLVIKNYTN